MSGDARVDAYLAKLPADQRDVLAALRVRVHELSPEAEETISYGMPAFKLNDRFFLSYAGWKRHCSIYPIDEQVLERHADAIRGYRRTTGSLHFSAAQPLPDALLADLVAQRANDLRGGREY